MQWENIRNANTSMKMIDVKGKDYVEVNQRVLAFRELEPNGSIETDILSCENGVVTMKATVRDSEGKVLATGLAYEKESSSFINKTSYIENCETSAVGRALGFCGLGITTSISSAEEVSNKINNQTNNKSASTKKSAEKPQTASSRDKVMALASKKGISAVDLAKKYQLSKDTTEERFAEVLKEMESEA